MGRRESYNYVVHHMSNRRAGESTERKDGGLGSCE